MATTKQKFLIGIISLVVLTASFYLFIPEKVRIDIQPTKTTFKVWENNSWVLSGTEYTKIYDGTSLMRANDRTINYSLDLENNKTTSYRYSFYKENISVIDIYEFDGNIDDVELFPVSHEIKIVNGKNKILVYEVNDLLYTGETKNNISSPQLFGHKMKVEWEEGNYYSRIFKYSNKDVGKLEVKYKIDSDNFSKNVRLFDPEGTYIDSFTIGIIEANGITTDNNFIWITNASTKVYKYFINGTYISNTFDTSSTINDNPISITTNGTFIWILDNTDDQVYQYFMNGTYTTINWDTNGIGASVPYEITTDNNFIYISDDSDDDIYIFYMNGTYTGNVLLNLGSIAAWSIATSINYLFLSYDGTNIIYKLTIDGNDEISSFPYNTFDGNSDTQGITINGTHLWQLDDADNEVYIYQIDTISLTYSDNQTNSTIANQSTLFSLYINDETALHANGTYIFSTNNSGVWANETAVNFTATPSWANVTKVLNSTGNLLVGYRWYLWDNSRNQNNTGIFTLTTTSTDTCTYSSGNWDINCSDNCVIYSNVNLEGNNISIIGTGTFTTTANITNFKRLFIQGTDSSNKCTVRCINGGCFR